MAEHPPYKTSLGIVATGLVLVAGGLAVGLLVCGGGFGSAVLEKLPEIVYAPEPVVIPATSHRLPDVIAGRPPEPAQPSPAPVAFSTEPPVFREPARWTQGAGTPVVPEPVAFPPAPQSPVSPPGFDPVLVPLEPLQPVLQPVPMPFEPRPVVPVPLAPSGPAARVSLSGDAVSVVAVSAQGPRVALPGSVPPGTYDVVVTFAGREPFSAGSLLVLDAGPRSVTCRSSLGICKIR